MVEASQYGDAAQPAGVDTAPLPVGPTPVLPEPELSQGPAPAAAVAEQACMHWEGHELQPHHLVKCCAAVSDRTPTDGMSLMFLPRYSVAGADARLSGQPPPLRRGARAAARQRRPRDAGGTSVLCTVLRNCVLQHKLCLTGSRKHSLNMMFLSHVSCSSVKQLAC